MILPRTTNRTRATYTLADDSLVFGPVIATSMSCTDGDELEQSYFAVLERASRYEVADSCSRWVRQTARSRGSIPADVPPLALVSLPP